MPRSLVKLLVLSVLAGWWAIEHLRLALRRDGPHRTTRETVLGLAIPGHGAVRAFRAGHRFAACWYFALLVAYGVLRLFS